MRCSGILVKCDECGSIYMTSMDIYYRRKARTFRCRTCLNKLRVDRLHNISNDEKLIRRDKISKSVKKRFGELSDEEKQNRNSLISNSAKSRWNNMSEENRLKGLEKLWKGNSEYNNNLSDTERKLRSEKLSTLLKTRWENLSLEEKNIIGKNISKSLKRYYNNLTDDEKERRKNQLEMNFRRWYESLSDEEKHKYIQMKSKQAKKQWDQLSKENKKYRIDAMSKGIKKWYNNLSDDEKFNHLKHMWDKKYYEDENKIGPTEIIFNNTLKSLGFKSPENYVWGYLSYKKNADYDTSFNDINPITQNKTFPFHKWDFKINLLNQSILVDIDGSIHSEEHSGRSITSPKGFQYTLYDNIKFYDSKRIYQTDEMDAYIIECYDDDLKDDTPVLHLQSNTRISYKDFLILIQAINIPKKKYKKMI